MINNSHYKKNGIKDIDYSIDLFFIESYCVVCDKKLCKMCDKCHIENTFYVKEIKLEYENKLLEKLKELQTLLIEKIKMKEEIITEIGKINYEYEKISNCLIKNDFKYFKK